MAVKILFEDNDNTPSSHLLKKSFYGNHIYFANGASKVLRTALEIKQKTDIIYILYDVSPNNRKTVKGYNELINTIKSYGYTDIFVFPIICIEYYICKLFLNFHYFYWKDKGVLELIEKLVATFDWNSVSLHLKEDDYINSSLEHTYKQIISKQAMSCLRNKYKYLDVDGTIDRNAVNGKFYSQDCNCERYHCKINCMDHISLKANRFFELLPIFDIVSGQDKNTPDGEERIKAAQHCQMLYDSICENMKIPKIKIR